MAPGFFLLDDREIRREVFSPGETIFAAASGLPKLAPVTIELESTGRPATLLARLTSDRHGALPITPIIPYVGLLPFDGGNALTHAEARAALVGKTHEILATTGNRDKPTRHALAFQIDTAGRQVRVFPSDPDGRLVTGIESGSRQFGVTLRNFPAGCVRVFMVPRQFGWRTGDPIHPVATQTVSVQNEKNIFVRFAAAHDFATGSYQFIARPYVPGWYQADESMLLAEDVVSDRRFASLVIRYPFGKKFDHNGIVLTPQVAGRPLAHRPYFHFTDNFPKGTDVYAALDPDALPPGLVGKKAAIYVIAHKTAAQWAGSNALTDVSGPGMTPAPKIVPIVPGCVNWNSTLVWPNPQVPGKYDVAIDLGNNVADPSLFATDGTLDAPLDMIDGYVRVGFYVTEDPSLPGPFAGTIGNTSYALPAINVPSTSTGPTPTDSLPLTATIRYPATHSGTDAPVAADTHPLIVMMHGNSGMDTSYLGYNYLLDHLASWGFIAMSIYAPSGVGIETRARAILAHAGIMAQNQTNPGLFQGHVDLTKIGIAGHSRGAEAVVRAAIVNTNEALGWNILAGISVAPTDYNHSGAPGIPLLVIYGANDGDVSGSWPGRTCFDIYDEAGRPRTFVFVYGATHDRFNTEWASIEATTELTWDITASDIPHLISPTDHENVAKGYMTAFFQANMLGRSEQLEYFSAGLKPSLTSGLQIYTSHQTAGSLVLDSFTQNNPALNTLGGVVTPTALPTFNENQLRTLDSHSPHVVAGGNVAWQNNSGVYLTQIPAAHKDLSGYVFLSFRVSEKYESPRNAPGQPQDFSVRLTDLNGRSRAIRVSTFTTIPYPYVRGHDDLVKSAMQSVRIPLASFTIANLGAQDVDVANVASMAFEFDGPVTGELDIDDIEFSVV